MSKNGLPCPNPKCGSSHAYGVQDNGWGHCFKCGMNYPPKAATKNEIEVMQVKNKTTSFEPVDRTSFGTAEDRNISAKTASQYKTWVNGKNTVFPVFDKNGNQIGTKTKLPDTGDGKKLFRIDGTVGEAALFGQEAFPAGSAHYITVTEGEFDAMSGYELLGSKYPVVSLVNGASSAERDAKNNYEYLNSFKEIVLNFDSDTAGQEAAQKVAAMFEPNKVRILSLAKAKDANEYLKRNAHKIYTKEWWAAPKFALDGLKLGSSLWDDIWNRPQHFSVLYPFDGLNRLTYGLRLSEFVLITADTGVGKTSIMKELEYSILMNPEVIEKKYGVGFMHFEEPNGDTGLGLLGIHNSKPYHLPDTPKPEEEVKKAYTEVLDNDRVVIWDHFGSNQIDAVIAKVRHMHALGCRYIVIDHLSIIVSDQSGDERKQLDEISTKLKTLCMQLNIALICVIHTNRQGQVRGTAGVEQLANIVIKLTRDKTDLNEWRRNVTQVMVEKNRFCGRTGPACYLHYNENTGRLSELSRDEVETFEAGGAIGDDETPF